MTEKSECIRAREYAGGIVAIDSGMVRPEMAACYLLETAAEAVVIETGNAGSVSRILDTLQRRGWSRDQVRHVIVTHVHLDHAGGAGRLLAELPQATLHVHPRGARHMVDPSRLEASARGVYGDEAFDAMYGALLPIPEERVRIMNDGDSLELEGRQLRFIDTPGHARHHFCVWDSATRGWFTGDTFGLSYRDLDTDKGPFVFPTTTPIQFDPAALITSVERLMDAGPECLYLTHFGRVGDVRRLADDMIAGVNFLAKLGLHHRDAEDRTRAIEQDMFTWLTDRCREHGVTLGDEELTSILAPDVDLNTQGIEFWLDHAAP
ncbi:MBL fold metallo-hydrolase [Elongatibacter sediminis]|uniref:MBL fold metallo-hydrolase n=1 Tax=Elongatibacter sediminis TaxID=3119006 RepID=A0AAW9R9I8_9GAMM